MAFDGHQAILRQFDPDFWRPDGQPFGPVEIIPDHKLVHGLLSATLFRGSGQGGTIKGHPDLAPRGAGRYAHHVTDYWGGRAQTGIDGAGPRIGGDVHGNLKLQFNKDIPIVVGKDLTVFARLTAFKQGYWANGLFGCGSDAHTVPVFYGDGNGSRTGSNNPILLLPSSTTLSFGAPALPCPGTLSVAVVIRWGVDARVFMNGTRTHRQTHTRSLAADTYIRVPFRYWDDGQAYEAVPHGMYVWDYALPDDLAAEVTFEPYGMFRPLAEIVVGSRVPAGLLLAATGFANTNAFGAGLVQVEQSVSGTGHADADLFGTARVDLGIAGTGYVNADSFGAGQLNLTINAAGYSSPDAFGAGQLSLRIDAVGYADPDVFGAGSIGQLIVGAGFIDSDAFGAGQLNLEIVAAGFSDADGFGTGQLNLAIIAVGYEDSDAFGAGTVAIGVLSITGTAGYADADAFGAGQLDLGLIGAGYADADAFGAGTLTLYLLGTGHASSSVFGAGAIGLNIAGQGFIDADAFGAGRLDLAIMGTGYGNPQGYGAGVIVPGGVSIIGTGYADGDAFGAGYLYFASPSGYKVVVHKPGRSQQVAGAGHKPTVPARPRSTIIIRRP